LRTAENLFKFYCTVTFVECFKSVERKQNSIKIKPKDLLYSICISTVVLFGVFFLCVVCLFVVVLSKRLLVAVLLLELSYQMKVANMLE